MRFLLLLAATIGLAAQGQPNPAYTPVEDDPALPRVLLIGDSISIGYTVPVRKMLSGKANVHRPATNSAHTRKGLEELGQWLGTGRWDVIHFNWGLHDLKRMEKGEHQVPLQEYERNIATLVARLKKTKARLIWASTTPVPEGKLNTPRVPADVETYNAAALAVMKKNKVAVDDLYAFAKPKLAEIQRPVNVHFTNEGSEALARHVVASISAELAKVKRK